jgi:hypothetical protein
MREQLRAGIFGPVSNVIDFVASLALHRFCRVIADFMRTSTSDLQRWRIAILGLGLEMAFSGWFWVSTELRNTSSVEY